TAKQASVLAHIRNPACRAAFRECACATRRSGWPWPCAEGSLLDVRPLLGLRRRLLSKLRGNKHHLLYSGRRAILRTEADRVINAHRAIGRFADHDAGTLAKLAIEELLP